MTEETNKKDEAVSQTAEKLFFKSRNVLVTGEVNDKLAKQTVTHLLALAEENDDPINMFISSPGGHVESGDMV
ncbi:ATP-dependent Clp protease proteolytic subunit, partial [Falsihalocynthiibacter sp. S25ZX9]|uniref:ATP-dependent Clp protease proteolytic subunit n=1 Tax=Falsihalocynthiibacter sp. S25ZX9 TaxID=3240870 RepID=UPI00350FE134